MRCFGSIDTTMLKSGWKKMMPDLASQLSAQDSAIRRIEETLASKLQEQTALVKAIETKVLQPMYFHGRDEKHGFWVYPENKSLVNKWDTHLPASTYCNNHEEQGCDLSKAMDLKKFKCLGHSKLADFEEAYAEWKREGHINLEGGFHTEMQKQVITMSDILGLNLEFTNLKKQLLEKQEKQENQEEQGGQEEQVNTDDEYKDERFECMTTRIDSMNTRIQYLEDLIVERETSAHLLKQTRVCNYKKVVKFIAAILYILLTVVVGMAYMKSRTGSRFAELTWNP